MKYELSFDFSSFNRAVVTEAKTIINKSFEENKGRFVSELKKKFTSAIKNSPEYRSLYTHSGRLRRDFGLGDFGGEAEGILRSVDAFIEIIELIMRQVEVTIVSKKVKTEYIIGLNITLFNDIDSIINSEAGKYISINQNGDYNEVPWLEWLLVGGAGPVIVGYHVTYLKEVSEESRTGLTLMNDGGSFSVDTKFVGTKNDNFITRAAESLESSISELINKHFIQPLQ